MFTVADLIKRLEKEDQTLPVTMLEINRQGNVDIFFVEQVFRLTGYKDDVLCLACEKVIP